MYYTDKMVEFLGDRTEEEKEKPFFGYLAYTAPHFPLQCFPEDKAKYKGRYDKGPVALREERLERMKKLGMIAPDCVPHPVTIKNPHGWTGNEWETMTEWERMMTVNAMEVYAGMIDRIDQEVGKVLRCLEESGEIDNTVIMFFSDNGAAGAALEANITMGPEFADNINKFYDNSEKNLGNHNSYLWLGPRYALLTCES